MAMDQSIAEEPKAKYIAYKLTTNFVDVVVQKKSLKIFLNMPSGKLNEHARAARLPRPRLPREKTHIHVPNKTAFLPISPLSW